MFYDIKFSFSSVPFIHRSLAKRLKISMELGRDWEKDLDYLMMYNTTPHSTTDMTPTKMLRKTTIRSKIPFIDDIETAVPVSTEAHDRDAALKYRGIQRENERRQARPSDIRVGDSVLMQNMAPFNQSGTTFKSTRFEVTDRVGSRATVADKNNGTSCERNFAQLKVFPPRSERGGNESREDTALQPVEDETFQGGVQVASVPIIEPHYKIRPRTQPASDRPRRVINKSAWQHDYEVNQVK